MTVCVGDKSLLVMIGQEHKFRLELEDEDGLEDILESLSKAPRVVLTILKATQDRRIKDAVTRLIEMGNVEEVLENFDQEKVNKMKGEEELLSRVRKVAKEVASEKNLLDHVESSQSVGSENCSLLSQDLLEATLTEVNVDK